MPCQSPFQPWGPAHRNTTCKNVSYFQLGSWKYFKIMSRLVGGSMFWVWCFESVCILQQRFPCKMKCFQIHTKAPSALHKKHLPQLPQQAKSLTLLKFGDLQFWEQLSIQSCKAGGWLPWNILSNLQRLFVNLIELIVFWPDMLTFKGSSSCWNENIFEETHLWRLEPHVDCIVR